ncbi:MAG: hypothetical protein ABI807_01535, partial [Sporichthyaceae bacterium]
MTRPATGARHAQRRSSNDGSRRAISALAGLSAALTGASGAWLSPAAAAQAAPGQDVDNDWGQSAAETAVEVAGQVESDPRVVAARATHRRAVARRAAARRAERAAITALRAARHAPGTDLPAAHALFETTRSARRAARAELAARRALAAARAEVAAAVRARHYVRAPYVELPG